MRTSAALLALLSLCASLASAADEKVSSAIAAVKKVDREGQGNAQAKSAALTLSSADPSQLTAILAGMDDANTLALNWLAGAFEAAAQKAGDKLPAKDLETFLLDRSHNARARRLAFEWLTKADSSSREKLVPGLIDDPSPELRREAVSRLIDLAKKAEGDAATKLYREAFDAAVDGDQVAETAKVLKKAGEDVNLVEHFGFVTDWTLIGPFDNLETKGFNVTYPPEKEVDLKKEYEGLKGTVKWESKQAPVDPAVLDPEKVGVFDIAKLTAPHKGAATYAMTEFSSDKAQPVEFRLATSNAWKLWLNGKLVFAREEYHRGMFFDQYIVEGELQPGKNTLLLKVCQNEQTEDWAQDWSFQFRVCDASGKAVLPTEPKATTQR
jgi:hypothetical protein